MEMSNSTNRLRVTHAYFYICHCVFLSIRYIEVVKQIVQYYAVDLSSRTGDILKHSLKNEEMFSHY